MAKRSEPIERPSEVDDIRVRLKTVLGIPPTTYVPAIWGFFLIAVLFLFLLYPGIRNYGSIVTVTSAPQGAEVTVDGRRVGATPVTTFIDAGSRVVSVSLPGHQRVDRNIDIRGRRIASLVNPRREEIAFRLTDFDAARVLTEGVREFSAWSTSGGASAQFQYPPSANETARYLLAGATDPNVSKSSGGSPDLYDFLSYFVPHVTEPQRADLLAGAVRLSTSGGLLGPDAFAGLIEEIVQYENDSSGFYRVLGVFDSNIEGHPWYRSAEARYSTDLLATSVVLDESEPSDILLIDTGPFTFARVPPGVYVIGYPAREEESSGRHVRFNEAIWIQSTEVTEAQFERFLEADRSWSPENREELFATGLADDTYLDGWVGDDERTLTQVSFFAAQAFVRWLNEESPYDPPRGYRFALPTAEEWEYSAFLNDGAWSNGSQTQAENGALGIPIMSGGVWEWTETWDAVYGRFLPVRMGDQRVVIGGSSMNDDAGHALRGAQPPDWTTPFLGFRLVLRPQTDG